MKLKIAGKKFGRLLVLGEHKERGKNGDILWKCVCDCGEEVIVRGWCMNTGATVSCGCYKRERSSEVHMEHGLTGSPTYASWQNMKDRCSNPNNKAYGNYGGRGISYDPLWEKFENFFADMGECPEGMTLDRIDVNGDYCKENCRWSDYSMQGFNKRKLKKNTSGRTGVNWFKPVSMWRAYIAKDGKQHSLGYFHDFNEAVKARENAELHHYGFIKEE